MSQKYTDARYPEKINDLVDNEGQISEEGKKAIEDAGVEAKDPRLPELTPEDVGKMLSVDEEGNYVLVDAPSGGTKLYKHSITVIQETPADTETLEFIVVNNSSSVISKESLLPELLNCFYALYINNDGDYWNYLGLNNRSTTALEDMYFGQGTAPLFDDFITTVSDTVTEL